MADIVAQREPASCSPAMNAELAATDAVLAGARAAHRLGPGDHAIVERTGARHLVRIVGSNSTTTWKLPSPTWPTIGAVRPLRVDVAPRLDDALGEP